MNKKYLKLLNEFANNHSLANEIKVEITEHQKSFKPRSPFSKAYYDEANLLVSILTGAESFCNYLQRRGYGIRKNNHKDNK